MSGEVTPGPVPEPGVEVTADEDNHVGDATVVIDRNARTDNDMTVAVDRAKPVDEETVVVERNSLVGDATVVVQRTKPVDESTVVVERNGAASESTVVVNRGVEAPKAPPTRVPRGRQRINLPPVDPGFAERAVLAAGPGAVESYAPRQLPPEPVVSAQTEQSVKVARPPAEVVPSVRKSSRRFGIVAVIGFGVACLVSVVGLATIAFLVLRSL